MKPVAIISITVVVPLVTPAMYHKLRKTPNSEAVAAIPKVAGPGLPISGMAVSRSRARFSGMVIFQR